MHPNLAAPPFEAVSKGNDMKCKVCGMSMRRLERKGFLQNKIYPMFGYYPWECPGCRKPVMLKKQHWRKRRTAHQDGLE